MGEVIYIPTLGAAPLTAPTSLTATQATNTQVDLAWTDNSGTAFEIYKNGVLLTTTAVGATSYSATSLTAGTTYVFAVRAVSGANYSAFASVAIVPVYLHGSPYGTANGSESNVVAQWVFNESSGNILDKAGSVDLTPTQTGAASWIQYNCRIGYSYNPEVVSPGLLLLNKSSNAYSLQSAATSLNFGTGSATLEWIARYFPKNNGETGGATIYYTCDNSVAHGVYLYYDNIATTPRLNVWIKASDGTLINSSITLSTNPFDFNIHKHRIKFDRSGNAQYYIDGVSQGTVSLASISGKTIECSQVILGQATTGAVNVLCCVLYEFRQSSNATNNEGGPGGG